MKKADYSFYVVDPAILTDLQGKAVELGFRIVEQREGRWHRSKKHIQLTLTPATLVQMMATIQGAKQKFGWPDPPPLPPAIHVPPAKDRN